MVRQIASLGFALLFSMVPALQADPQIVNASTGCAAVALSANSSQMSEAWRLGETQNNCCPCDYSYSYQLCYQGCNGDSSCQQNCFNEWTQAEWECGQTCPWPIC